CLQLFLASGPPSASVRYAALRPPYRRPVPPRRGLNNVRVQLVIVSPRTFCGGIQELIRILPGTREAIQHPRLQHILGPVSGAGLLEEPLPDDFHHFPFRLELGPCHDRTGTWNELRPLIADSEQEVHRG